MAFAIIKGRLLSVSEAVSSGRDARRCAAEAASDTRRRCEPFAQRRKSL